MPAESRDLDTRLAQWRDAGAGNLAPLPFHLLRAMAERLANHGGEAHALLSQRLDALVERHAPAIDAALAANRCPQEAHRVDPAPDSTIAGLLARLAREEGGTPVADTGAGGTAPPAMDALGEARRAWSGVRMHSQLRQSLQPTAEDAGPLNSGRLVERMLARLQVLSPGYVQHFVSYLDALAWLDDHQHAGAAPGSASKPARRRKPRTSGRSDATRSAE